MSKGKVVLSSDIFLNKPFGEAVGLRDEPALFGFHFLAMSLETAHGAGMQSHLRTWGPRGDRHPRSDVEVRNHFALVYSSTRGA